MTVPAMLILKMYAYAFQGRCKASTESLVFVEASIFTTGGVCGRDGRFHFGEGSPVVSQTMKIEILQKRAPTLLSWACSVEATWGAWIDS